jgi:hypothetical protein
MGSKEFAEALSGENVVRISFVRSKNGKRRTIPVWFAVEGGRIQLLPMYGLKTKWYQDVEKSGKVELSVKNQRLSAAPRTIREQAKVEQIKSVFARKYGSVDVNRYYPTSDVAFEIPL